MIYEQFYEVLKDFFTVFVGDYTIFGNMYLSDYLTTFTIFGLGLFMFISPMYFVSSLRSKAFKYFAILMLIFTIGITVSATGFGVISNNEQTQELKGFTARDIQFIESVGFIDNLDGSWSITVPVTPFGDRYYYFDYQPTSIHGKIIAIRMVNTSQLNILMNDLALSVGNLTIWGGDLS